MGYVLTVYNEKRYREFFLSEQDRAEQELLLLKQEFGCGETVRVRVKRQRRDGSFWMGRHIRYGRMEGTIPESFGRSRSCSGSHCGI